MSEPRADRPWPAQTKFTAVKLATSDGEGTFAGYASLFDRVDLGRDRVVRGAFRRSLAERGTSGVRMLWQHDPNEPIGVWQLIEEDHKGLFVRGRLSTTVNRAREALALMRQGALDGLSIGFRTARSRIDPKSGVRELTEIDLWEISLVTFPMLPEARVARVKTAELASSDVDQSRLADLLRQGARRLRLPHFS
jgi:HK97 family phage prohead protease